MAPVPPDEHLERMRAISQAEIRFVPSLQQHRNYWLSESDLPESLKSGNHFTKTLLSDYGEACREIDNHWRCRNMNQSDDLTRMIKSFSKRDSVSRMLNGDNTKMVSQYRSVHSHELSVPVDKEHHLKKNAITEFAQEFFKQKALARK